MAKVELKKLFKTYNKKIRALEDINLTIEDGQFFVLQLCSIYNAHLWVLCTKY